MGGCSSSDHTRRLRFGALMPQGDAWRAPGRAGMRNWHSMVRRYVDLYDWTGAERVCVVEPGIVRQCGIFHRDPALADADPFVLLGRGSRAT